MNGLPDDLKPLERLQQSFPRAAVEAAIARREESTPHLLRALEWTAAHPEEANKIEPPWMLHLFAMFLLAQFRETSAYAPVVRLFRHPLQEALTGDVATENLPGILASVCGSDAAMIQQMIEDEEVDEFVRGSAVAALGALALAGIKSWEEISNYFGTLFRGRLQREPSQVWDALIGACSDLRMHEHLDDIRALYRDEIADPWVDRLKDLEARMKLPIEAEKTRHFLSHYALIDDTVAEMERWDCFQPEEEDEDAEDDFEEASYLTNGDFPSPTAQSAWGETPKIGRNEACPCGSGKKYKKCCGGAG